MAKRLLSTFLLWGVLLGVVWYFRTAGALVLITVVSVLTLREFYQLQRASGQLPFVWLGLFFGVFITLSPWLQPRYGMTYPLSIAVVMFSLRILGERTPENRVESLSATLFGLAYVPLLLQYMVRIVTPVPNDVVSADGRLLLCLWLIAVVKFCDVGALLTGLAIGRHKMSPGISPKKTWEGAAGGVLTAMAVGALVAWLARSSFPANVTPLFAALIAAPIAVAGIVSDLVESIIKRRANAKDSGAGIPGIGGVFDLADSLILAAPIGYLLLGLP